MNWKDMSKTDLLIGVFGIIGVIVINIIAILRNANLEIEIIGMKEFIFQAVLSIIVIDKTMDWSRRIVETILEKIKSK